MVFSWRLLCSQPLRGFTSGPAGFAVHFIVSILHSHFIPYPLLRRVTPLFSFSNTNDGLLREPTYP